VRAVQLAYAVGFCVVFLIVIVQTDDVFVYGGLGAAGIAGLLDLCGILWGLDVRRASDADAASRRRGGLAIGFGLLGLLGAGALGFMVMLATAFSQMR
jgi:hypothetical protein